MEQDLNKKILVFDTETTGLEDNDQLIQLAWGWWDGSGGLTESHSFKCMPTIEWKSDWHDEHHLSMADIEGHPSLSSNILEAFITDVKSADYVLGYNVDFDLTVLEREFARIGEDPTVISCKQFIDPMVIWNKSEGRKLVDAHKRWVGTVLEGAHDAEEDATGTVAILPGMLREFGLESLSLSELAGMCYEKEYVDRTGKMKWVDNKPVLNCTKYNYFGDGTGTNVSGLNVWEVARRDNWYANNYHTFKSVHRSVNIAFRLAMGYIDDESAFLRAMAQRFGPPTDE